MHACMKINKYVRLKMLFIIYLLRYTSERHIWLIYYILMEMRKPTNMCIKTK